MSSKTLKTRNKIKIATGLSCLVALSACDENGGFEMPSFGGGDTPETATLDGPAVSLVERDVEAPEVFSVDENGLWDGRPSLGGVWVAHPDAVDPERVIIRNEANGSFVIGALFRRERENPGPALQVSSDAAEELGVLAGAPTRLSVVALRREEGPAATETPVLETAALEAPVDVAAAPLSSAEDVDDGVSGNSIASIAEAAIAAAEPETTAVTPTVETSSLEGAAAIAIAAAEAANSDTASAPQPASAAAPVSSLDKPFIQIGIFSVEANARRTNAMLRDDGLLGTVIAQSSNGRPFWRVVVGPAPTEADRAEVLRKVKALGFADAYFVTN